MNKKIICVALISLVLSAVLFREAEAGLKIKLKKLAKIGLLAHALSGKKILLPLPLPLPIPLLKENAKFVPYPVNHHSTAVVGYGYEHQGGHYGGGGGGHYGGGGGGHYGGGGGGFGGGGGYGGGGGGGHYGGGGEQGWW